MNPTIVSGPMFTGGGLYHFILRIKTVDSDESLLPVIGRRSMRIDSKLVLGVNIQLRSYLTRTDYLLLDLTTKIRRYGLTCPSNGSNSSMSSSGTNAKSFSTVKGAPNPRISKPL